MQKTIKVSTDKIWSLHGDLERNKYIMAEKITLVRIDKINMASYIATELIV